MFLKHQPSQQLVEVLTLQDLWDPCLTAITGRFHAGEELQEPETFAKAELVFPSDEGLPECWLNPHYREVRRDPTGQVHNPQLERVPALTR